MRSPWSRTPVASVVAALAVPLLLLTGCAPIASGVSSALDRATGRPGPADGVVLDARPVSPFAEDEPAIARLDPALRAAVQRAASAAGQDDVPFVVTSGWRSARYQRWLLDRAIERYGSAEEAAHWVSTPEESEHVKGRAVDIGFTDADSWLQQHGSDYGLCRMYANEMWHFELATTPGGECPAQWASAAERAAHPR